MRISDAIWDKGKAVATANGTTMTPAIVAYIKTLKVSKPVGLHLRQRPLTKGSTRNRVLRINDETWALAKKVADENGISRTVLITAYIRMMTQDARPSQKGKKMPAAPRGGWASSPPQSELTDKAMLRRPKPPPRGATKETQATCEHLAAAPISFGVFCRKCGKKLEDAP
jgi:hypothetical protein